MIRLASLLAVVMLLPGCAALDGFEQALEEAGVARFQVSSRNHSTVLVSSAPESGRGGCGAIVGARTVLTVAHVVGDAATCWVQPERGGGWREARVISRIASSPEPILVLELSAEEGTLAELFSFTGFSASRCLSPDPSGEPAVVAHVSGTYRWDSRLQPGFSGSPVLTGDGRVLGLVSARRPDGTTVIARLPGEQLPIGELSVACLGLGGR